MGCMETVNPSAPASREGWSLVIFALALVAVFASLVGVGLGLRAVDESRTRGEQGGTETIQATLSEFSITLSSSQVGGGPHIEVTNGGTATHNLAVRDHDLTTPDLGAGASGALDL